MPKQTYPGLYAKHGAWHYRYYERALGTDGKLTNCRKTVKLASLEECPTVASVVEIYHAVAGKAVKDNSRLVSTATLAQFWHQEFMPWIAGTKKPSTVKTYRDTWSRHFETTLGAIRLRDFRKRDAISALEVMAYQKGLVHSTIHQGRTLLGSIFKRACVLELVEHNPIRDFETPRAENNSRHKGEAYTGEEVEAILRVLAGRARVIAAILAYTGIRPQELAGLDWADYDGDWLHIRRAVWQGKVVDVKTEESAASIPVVEPLREILDAYKATVTAIGWLICGETAQPINLGNVARREVRPVLKKYGIQWKTWYGFRRGAATILADDLNLSEDEVRAILRHAPGSTTARDHYIVRQDRKRQSVMDKFAEHIAQVRERTERPVLVS